MCGFAGAVQLGVRDDGWRRRLEAMGDAVRHRGPDDADVWWDAALGVGLAHRRLAVIDLSSAGRQPMHSTDGRYVLAYNGEIYNFETLRRADTLRGRSWRGHSDTEVMLAAFQAWEIDEAVRRFNGMFAFALVDRRDRVLWLGRDRLGIKPLYYGRCGDTLLFGSELKALRAHPAFDAATDPLALGLLLRLGYVPAPHCIHRGLRKLEAGSLLRIPLDAAAANGAAALPAPRRYWCLEMIAAQGRRHPFGGDEKEALDELDRRIGEAVARRRIADVPLGAFLSGGVDSSLVVARMCRDGDGPVETFSIGFAEDGYDESDHARRVAEHLGTRHTERRVSPDDARGVIPDLPRIWDEPFADPSQIPTALVSGLARERVTVSLSGDGGDELFGGYKRYTATRELWALLRRVPAGARDRGGEWLGSLPPALLDSAAGWLEPIFGRYGRQGRAGDKLLKLAELVGSRDPAGLYLNLISLWRRPEELVEGLAAEATAGLAPWPQGEPDLTTRMMTFDGAVYLPDDILTKLDRASMAVSLEARVPLLDHEVVEFVWTLPPALRHGESGEKRLLRRLLYRDVPRSLVDRPKMGFGAPVGAWIRGPLREWAQGLLDPTGLRREGLLRPQPIRRRLEEHLAGQREWGASLWAVLMYRAWAEVQH